MIYRIGTEKEAMALREKLLPDVYEELVYELGVLDSNYGTDRNYYENGGYAVVAETSEDMEEVKAHIINYEDFPCEWSFLLKDSDYIVAIYVLDNDCTLSLCMPRAITPPSILDICV